MWWLPCRQKKQQSSRGGKGPGIHPHCLMNPPDGMLPAAGAGSIRQRKSRHWRWRLVRNAPVVSGVDSRGEPWKNGRSFAESWRARGNLPRGPVLRNLAFCLRSERSARRRGISGRGRQSEAVHTPDCGLSRIQLHPFPLPSPPSAGVFVPAPVESASLSIPVRGPPPGKLRADWGRRQRAWYRTLR